MAKLRLLGLTLFPKPSNRFWLVFTTPCKRRVLCFILSFKSKQNIEACWPKLREYSEIMPWIQLVSQHISQLLKWLIWVDTTNTRRSIDFSPPLTKSLQYYEIFCNIYIYIYISIALIINARSFVSKRK